MIYQKFCKNRRISKNGGLIIIDILLALALGAVFVGVLGEASGISRALFERSRSRAELIDAYENGRGGEFAAIASTTQWYGNDRQETITTISEGSSSIAFSAVHARSSEFAQAAGTPLCSVDFTGSRSAAEIAQSAVIRPILLPIDPALPLTDLEVRHGIAYVSADSSAASDPDFLIFNLGADAHDSPQLISSLSTGPGIAAVALAGPFVYAAAASSAGQLQIIDIRDRESPVMVRAYRLPPPFATATEPFGTAISYASGTIYLGTQKWPGEEMAVLDVADPLNPQFLEGIEIGSKVSDLAVREGFVYETGAGERQIRVFKAADPAHLSAAGSPPLPGWSRQEGVAVQTFEDDLIVGRTSGGFDIAAEHELFAGPIATSSAPFPENFASSKNIPGGAYGLVADRRHIYAATREIDKEFQILTRDLASTSPASESVSFSLPVAPQILTCDGDMLYVLAHTAPVIYEITFP